MSGSKKGQVLRFRKGLLCVVASAAGAGMFAFFVIIAFTHPQGSDVPGAVIFSAFVYFFWLIGWQSGVRLDAAGVKVDNLLVRHDIPWEELADITSGNGMEFRLRDGRKVHSLHYGGSLLGAILGDRYTWRVADRMCVARQDMMPADRDEVGEQAAYRPRFHMPLGPPLVILAANELVAALALIIR